MKTTSKRATIGLLALALSVLAGARALAEPTRELRVAGPNEVFDGDPESVSLTARGYVLPGPELKPVAEVGPAVTRMVPTERGFLLGTTEGSVVAAGPGGKLGQPVLPAGGSGVVTALSHGPGGTFVAVAPGGQIWRFEDGALEPVAKLEVRYVWDLAQRGRQLYAVTGQPGQLVRIRPGRPAEVLFEADEQHLRALDVDGDRIVFASGDRGIVYSMEDGKVRALYDSDLSEATVVSIEPEGVVAAFADAKKKAALQPYRSIGEIGKEDDSGPFKGSELVQVDAAGRIDVLWRSQREGALDLLRVGEELWLATAGSEKNKGRIYGVDLRRGELRVVTRVDGPMVTALAARGDVRWAAVAPAGRLVRVGPGMVRTAVYRSSEQDFQRVGRVGRLWFDAKTSRGSRVEIRIRTGNTEKADGAWSEWSDPVGEPDGARVSVPRGRFAQFEARLFAGGNEPPVLRSMHASVTRLNDPPRLIEVFTLRPGVRLEPLPTDPDRDKTITLSRSALNGLRGQDDDSDRTRVRQSTQPGMLTVAWHAADTNGDQLRYAVRLERLKDGATTRLADRLDVPFHSFDSRAFPDGRYVFRVTASDRLSNRPSEASSADRMSSPVLIDNTAPVFDSLRATRRGRRVRVEARVHDEQSPLKRCEVSVDGESWVLMPAADGIVDAKAEILRLDMPIPERSVVVSVRVTDDAGNETTRSTTFSP
jgi:outer membrane protein assembly factor BamB